MNFSRKLAAISGALIFAISSQSALAMPTKFYGDDTVLTFSVKGDFMTPEVKEQYLNFIDMFFNQVIFLDTNDAGWDGSEITTTYLEHLEEEPLEITVNKEGQAALFIESPQSDYTKFLEIFEQYGSMVENLNAYAFNNNFFTYQEDYTVISEKQDPLSSIINGCETGCFSQSLYKDISEGFFSDSILNFFVQDTETTFGEIDELPNLDAAGLSIKQTDNGIKARTRIKSKTNLTTSTKKPSLYKSLPGKNNILYFHAHSDTVMGEAIAQSINEFGTFEGEVALAIQESETLLPSFTIMFSDQNFSQVINSDLEEEFEILDLPTRTIFLDGTPLKQHIFKLDLSESNNPYDQEIAAIVDELTMTFGIVDGQFIFSTNPNINSEYGNGINGISGISAPGTNLLHFNGEALKQQLINIVEASSSTTEAEINAIEELFEDAGKFTITTKVRNLDTKIWEANMEMDFNLAKVLKDLLEQPGTTQASLETITNISNSLESISSTLTKSDFEDVTPSDWFASDVYYLQSIGVINSQNNSQFRPNDYINRAEFTKMILTALQKEGFVANIQTNSAFPAFNDIQGTWYEAVAQTASEYGLINGYQTENGKEFKGKNHINRAEAAQLTTTILNSYSFPEGLVLNNPTVFPDVSSSDWYYQAVNEASSFYELMNGYQDGSFRPEGKLTRAEAAKIIRQFIEMLPQLTF